MTKINIQNKKEDEQDFSDIKVCDYFLIDKEIFKLEQIGYDFYLMGIGFIGFWNKSETKLGIAEILGASNAKKIKTLNISYEVE